MSACRPAGWIPNCLSGREVLAVTYHCVSQPVGRDPKVGVAAVVIGFMGTFPVFQKGF